jgi:hypothetical protein
MNFIPTPRVVMNELLCEPTEHNLFVHHVYIALMTSYIYHVEKKLKFIMPKHGIINPQS